MRLSENCPKRLGILKLNDFMSESEIIYRVNPPITNEELNPLFAASWQNHKWADFRPTLERSLLFVCAYHFEQLVGFVYLAWDGGIHAFVLDTTVHREFRRRGVGTKLMEHAAIAAKTRGIEWIHVDYEPHLQDFYAGCGFKNTLAGLINLKQESSDFYYEPKLEDAEN